MWLIAVGMETLHWRWGTVVNDVAVVKEERKSLITNRTLSVKRTSENIC